MIGSIPWKLEEDATLESKVENQLYIFKKKKKKRKKKNMEKGKKIKKNK